MILVDADDVIRIRNDDPTDRDLNALTGMFLPNVVLGVCLMTGRFAHDHGALPRLDW